MFPMTVTISNPAQLNAVMAALGVAGIESAKSTPCAAHAAESAREEAKSAKKAGSKPEKAQAEVAQNTASNTSEPSSPAEVAVENSAPEAATPSASGAADVTQMTAGEAEKALHGHANRPADAPTYQATADAVTKLAKAKGRDAAVAVLTKFGAAKLPEVKPEDFAAVIAACEEAGA